MRLGDVTNAEAAGNGKPLDGVRVLALEQMQALPWCTQLLARLGADVVKVEHPEAGDSGRGSLPAMTDPDGRSVGATFLRNNLNKRSIGIDLKHPLGRQLVLDLAPRFDVVAENSKAGAITGLGLGYDDIAAVHPAVVYLSVSGFGNPPGPQRLAERADAQDRQKDRSEHRGAEAGSGSDHSAASPYDAWPAYAPIAEAMSGIYEFKRHGDEPPVVAPVGALGDIGSGLFATIGVLAALRHRDRTGLGQHVDIAMLDAMVAMTDLVTNFWSMGLRGGELGPLIMHGFRAADGWFIVQVGREPQFRSLVAAIGHPEWADDDRFATRQGWIGHLDDALRPAIEAWAADRSKIEACHALASVGVAAGPCFSDEDVVGDPHVAARHMLVEHPRSDGVAQPVLVPGNPVKLSAVQEGPESRVPWLGEHTDDLLAAELGFDQRRITELRAAGAIG